MRVYSIRLENFGPFQRLESVRLGPLATIVGQNDVGKSTMLLALQVFFDKLKLEPRFVNDDTDEDEPVVIEVAFTDLPEKIELEEGVETSLVDEMLLDGNRRLCIRKTYARNGLDRPTISVITHDFQDDPYAGLVLLNEKDINARLAGVGIEATRSGRGITNKGKREALKQRAMAQNIPRVERELVIPKTTHDLWRKLVALWPDYVLFQADTKLGVGETTFQSQFRPIIKAAAEDPEVVEARDTFTGAIQKALQGDVDRLFAYLAKHTDAFVSLSAVPSFAWDKAVTFDIVGKDQDNVEKPLDQRGSGMRRLLMVAFFQYLAERNRQTGGDFIFAVEEPENCLHPGLQRELAASFRRLADEGYQVIITSHSPVFAGASPVEDLALVVRDKGIARAVQSPDLEPEEVAQQLGVEPADQITAYHACVFVEGVTDIEFWKAMARKLKEAGHVGKDFDDAQIGFIICGGESLRHWINLRAMRRLNRRFAVVVDSDRASATHKVHPRKLEWKKACEEQGGLFFILRKREIENYIHRNALLGCGKTSAYDDYTDMKETFGDKVIKLARKMTADEILEMDTYVDKTGEHHELKEIIEAVLALPRQG